MFINDAFASAAAPAVESGSMAVTLTQLGLILLIFYFFLIRPQQKKMKEHTAMVEALKVGDRVLTSGGIYGVVKKLNGTEVTIEIAPDVNVSVERMTISGLAVQAEKTETVAKPNKAKKTSKK